MARVVRDRVADVRTFDVPVVMEEDTSDFETRGARHLDVADEPVAGEIDEIRELDSDSQSRVLQRDVGDQRILYVSELALPGGVVEPGEPAVDEEPGSAHVAHGLVGVPDPWKIDVANGIVGVEANQHVAVSDHEASRHGGNASGAS